MQCPKCLKTEKEILDRREIRSSLGSRTNRRAGVKSEDRTAPAKKVAEKVEARMEEHIEECDGER